MDTLLLIVFFFFGAIIGSFLNVVILRLRSGRGFGGRSLCFSCGTTLSFAELVPLGSFFTQGGKCMHCRAKISWQYPLVELFSGVLFMLLYARFGYLIPVAPFVFGGLFLYYGLLVSVLAVLSVYDLRHKILPDGLVAIFALAAFVGLFVISGDAFLLHVPKLWDVLAGLVIPLPFVILWAASRGAWMGLGDAKLMVGIGWMLGLSAGIAAVLLAFWIGAAASLLWILCLSAAGKKTLSLKMAIPFGPFLALAAVIVLLARIDFSSIMRIFG